MWREWIRAEPATNTGDRVGRRDALGAAMKHTILCLSMVLVLGACSGANDEDEQPGVASADDALTAEEIQLGANAPTDTEPTEPTAIDAVDPTTEVDADGLTIPNFDSIDQLEAHHHCHRVTGYRNGNPFKLCVVHVDGKLVERHTAHAFLDMRHHAANAGVHIYVVSGFRTMKEQRHLYWLYKHGQGNLAAPPGYSNHQSGHALDLNTSSPGVYNWLANHAHNYDFKRTVPSEAWHWEHW